MQTLYEDNYLFASSWRPYMVYRPNAGWRCQILCGFALPGVFLDLVELRVDL